jgi:hypothetical protein
MVEHEILNKLHVSHAEASLKRTPKVTFQELQSQQWTPSALNDDMNGIQWVPSECMRIKSLNEFISSHIFTAFNYDTAPT